MGLFDSFLKPFTKNTFDPAQIWFNKEPQSGGNAFENFGKNLFDPAEVDINKQKKAADPVPLPPLVMPTADSAEVQRVRRRRIAMLQAQSGRQSTILSDPSEARLGG